MARVAVIFSVIFSLFLLSHALHDPPTTVEVRDPQENTDRTTTALLPIDESSSSDASISTVDPDITRRISHSLRLPINRHFHHGSVIRLRRGCHHGPRRHVSGGIVTRDVEIPYGNDMVGIPGRRQIPRGFPGERRPFPMRTKVFGDDKGYGREVSKEEVRGWNPEAEWKELEHKKKIRKEREEDEEEWKEFGYKKKKKKERKEHEGEWKEFEHKKKKERKEGEEGDFMKRFWGFLNRF